MDRKPPLGSGWRRVARATWLGLALVVACADGPEAVGDVEMETLSPAQSMADSLERLFRATYEGAHTTVYEDSVPSCDACEIRLVPVGAFGELDDQFLLRDLPILVERDRRGRFYATVSRAWDHELILYEPDGTIVRQVGRPGGDGPGEFRRGITSMLVGPGDSLHVVHDLVMLSVFDSSGTHGRTVRRDADFTEPPTLVKVDEEGYMVAFEYILRGESTIARHRLHRFAHDGTHLRSFVRPGIVDMRSTMSLGWPVYAGPTSAWAGRDDSWWVASALHYRLERIDHRGEVDRVIGVRPPPDWHMLLNMSLLDDEGIMKRPHGRLVGFHQVDARFGVVVLLVPSPDWESVEERPHHQHSADRIAIEQQQELRDSVLDVIDLASGEVVARKRIPSLSYLTRDGTLYSVSVDHLGVISVEAFEVELVGWEGEER
jgi:hypothetical protein